MSATNERDIAMRAAKTDFKRALASARGVSEPWFCCQALAAVARFAPEEQVVKIAKEAFSAALSAPDAYQRVAATAWPLRALIERDQQQKAVRSLPQFLLLSEEIENLVNRSDALLLLWQAFFPVSARESILGLLVKCCNGDSKADYNVRVAVLILASEDVEGARILAASMPEGKYKRQAEQRLIGGERGQAREFFW